MKTVPSLEVAHKCYESNGRGGSFDDMDGHYSPQSLGWLISRMQKRSNTIIRVTLNVWPSMMIPTPAPTSPTTVGEVIVESWCNQEIISTEHRISIDLKEIHTLLALEFDYGFLDITFPKY